MVFSATAELMLEFHPFLNKKVRNFYILVRTHLTRKDINQMGLVIAAVAAAIAAAIRSVSQ